MSTARFRVLHAGPLITFQDSGRPGNMRFGVSASGPMDRLSFAAANLALGNTEKTTAIEVSMGGVILECTAGAVTLAVMGGQFVIDCDGSTSNSGSVLTVEAGQKLSIRAGQSGCWCYLAVAGTFQVPAWLGRTATHALTGFGGGLVRTGDELTIADAVVLDHLPEQVSPCDTTTFGGYVRAVLGPQDQHFTPHARQQFLSSEFTLSDAYDRMGVRLNGPALTMNDSLSIPSEPVLKGSVQVAGDGVATVLLADHQTTGGYPKIATVIGCDLDSFSQLRPRQSVRFQPITCQGAIVLARRIAIEQRAYLDGLRRLR